MAKVDGTGQMFFLAMMICPRRTLNHMTKGKYVSCPIFALHWQMALEV